MGELKEKKEENVKAHFWSCSSFLGPKSFLAATFSGFFLFFTISSITTTPRMCVVSFCFLRWSSHTYILGQVRRRTPGRLNRTGQRIRSPEEGGHCSQRRPSECDEAS